MSRNDNLNKYSGKKKKNNFVYIILQKCIDFPKYKFTIQCDSYLYNYQ